MGRQQRNEKNGRNILTKAFIKSSMGSLIVSSPAAQSSCFGISERGERLYGGQGRLSMTSPPPRSSPLCLPAFTSLLEALKIQLL